MSVLYCTIPHFAAALARRDDPERAAGPLVLVGPEDRVFGVSAEAAACGVAAGMTARMAQVRCPEARLRDADVARCRAELEALFQLLEGLSPGVEPHGWGAAYVDLGDLARNRADAVALCGEVGQRVRWELGEALQPALGWDSSKFTALQQVDTVSDWILPSIPGMGVKRLGAVRALTRPEWQPPSPQAIQITGWYLTAICFALRFWPADLLASVIRGSRPKMDTRTGRDAPSLGRICPSRTRRAGLLRHPRAASVLAAGCQHVLQGWLPRPCDSRWL